jgi:hypothetical protein
MMTAMIILRRQKKTMRKKLRIKWGWRGGRGGNRRGVGDGSHDAFTSGSKILYYPEFASLSRSSWLQSRGGASSVSRDKCSTPNPTIIAFSPTALAPLDLMKRISVSSRSILLILVMSNLRRAAAARALRMQ